ncbi:CHU large protein [Formosa agariphila KMM 3901]|uniref:CHU large protein n=1 Tax=Formosa agariphila (strain DSM 15362 / KCTC 12365 / LMG 23005 / KMM 3901 / M-2Alg 35-1) TaxID=1347342 RepID=T2KQQ3_FORAG|nr:T9SS type A sorting domain-containing protein [Formosa agariphila]CDF81177.1 CHU large protein [Formosa agariphila KMM 3901]
MKNFTSFMPLCISFKKILPFILLFLTLPFYGQTVTDVFPTRVTYETKITIVGTGFDETDRDNITITNIPIKNVKLVSPTEMTLEIDDGGSASGNDKTGILSIGGISIPSTKNTINYVGYLILNTKSRNYELNSKITEIFTNWDYNGNGYWKSSWYVANNQNTWPNDKHELLAFTYNGTTYSTGVDDALLNAKGISYSPEVFKAYSTNGVSGTTYGQNYIITGDLVDNVVGSAETGPLDSEISNLNIIDAVVDGKNGLELGTGITNFNTNATIRFFSGNGQIGAVNDAVPDLIITQIATAGGTDIYYYADEIGNIVGRPIRFYIHTDVYLTEWRMDLYRLNPYTNYDIATPVGRAYGTDETRPLSVIGLKLEYFEIDASNIADVGNINLLAGGTSDMAFLAYNTSAFEIKSPKIAQYPVSRYLCRLPNDTDITFSTVASIDDIVIDDGSSTSDPKDDIRYQWLKYNTEITGATTDSYTITNQIIDSDLATYKLKVINDYGTVILPVSLSEGGTPYIWNGTSWNLPNAYTEQNINVAVEDRSLIFSADYPAQSINLEGCDCTIPAGTNVIIKSGQSMSLYNNITVAGEIPAGTDPDNNPTPYVPEGTFTLENNASLVQINGENGNINEGDIVMKRNAYVNDVSDYIYWSSPVLGFNVNNIATSRVYQWDPQASDYGNWIAATNADMTAGEGYIARVKNASDFTVNFDGVPNNGEVLVELSSSKESVEMDAENTNWNLLGNPYPSAISAKTFLEDNTNLQGSVSIWTHNEAISNTENDPFYDDFGYNYSDQYIVHNGTGTTPSSPAFNGNIAAGQAFFVQLDEGTSNNTVKFTNDMRYGVNESVLDNSDFFRTSTEETQEKQLIWLSLISDSNSSVSTLVGYVEGATNEKDRLYDAYANYSGFNIYSLISEKKMTIQGRSLSSFIDSDQVSLGIDILTNGSYKIGIDHLEGKLFKDKNQAIFLEDTYLNMEHDLKQSPYAFTAVKGVTNDRFILKYKSSSKLSVKEDLVAKTYVFINNGALNIKSSKNITGIAVYDINGKQLINYVPSVISSSTSINFPFSKGVYLVNITLDNGIIVSKKLIH